MDKTIRALDRSIDVLEYLASQNEEVRISEIGQALEMPSSTLLRITHTLELHGLLVKHPLTGGFRLGPRLLYYSRSLLNSIDYRQVSRELMKKLRDDTKETVSLYIKQLDNRVCIEKFEGPEPLRASIQIGDILPLVSGGAGKVLLAYLNQSRIEVPQSVLEEIRGRGYATSHAEYQQGVSSVAAPIFDFHDNVVAALSVSGPSSRFKGDHMKEIIEKAKFAAAKISIALGYEEKVK